MKYIVDVKGISKKSCLDYRPPTYYDRNGNEIKAGMQIVFDDGKHEQVYATSDAQGHQDLGISATNEAFLKNHPDYVQEFYSLTSIDLNSVEICSADQEESGGIG